MKNKYIITIGFDTDEHFQHVLTKLNVISWNRICDSVTGEFIYRVDLSKYELLYVRLACKVTSISREMSTEHIEEI